MKWNEIFRTRKLLKRLISMSLCIGMAGGQLLSGIPIQAEEQTDHTAYNLPDDPVINPSITIQHYYNFPAMVLGNVEEDYNTLKNENGAYRNVNNERDLQFYLAGADDKENASSHYANNGKPMVVWNTDVRNGKLPENGSVVTDKNETNYKNNREKDPKSYVTLNSQESGEITIEKKLYKLFADETVKYLTKPQMRYMNKLYNNAEHSYNANYTLQEVWIGKDKNKTNSIKKEDFLVLHAPQLKTEDGISRHDPSKFVFTNNKDNANITETDNATGVQYGIDGNPANPNQVTVLVEEGIVIRLMFEATEGTTTLEDNVNFFDYDISDGGIYNTADDAQKTQNKRPTSEQKNFTSTVFINTEQKGINNSDNFSNEENKRSLPRLAFGNGDANLGTTLGSQTLNGNQINQVNGGNRFGALYPSWSPNTASRYYGSNLQGASFGLVTKVNSDGTLCWNNGLNAPALFSLGKEDVKYGKTIYEGLTAEEEEKSKKENGTVPENYSLQFNRVGGTYTLSGVTRDDTSTQVLSNLDKLPPCKSDVNKSIHTNEFWPLDQSGSYGTDGHDPIFGNTNQDIRYSNPSTNGVLPTSDDGKAHNAFFGMMTKIPFKLEENYCAPLRYFFYGDDDMFVFLNKLDASGNVTESKQIADLGGVHSSMGTYVNLWDFINEGNKAEIEDDTAQGDTIYKYVADKKTQADKAKANDEVQTTPAVASDSYELAVYYLERGASGSTCYMRFSVPFEGLAMDEAAMNGQVQVDKEVKHSLLNPDTEDEYVFQLELEAPDGTELNNQYAIEFFTLDEDDQGNTKETKIEDDKLPKYIAPNGTFKLKHNQRALISGLPRSGPKEDLVGSKHEGYYYKVSELGRYNNTADYVNPKYKDSGDDNLIHLEELSPTTSTTFRKGSVDKGLDQNYQEGTSFDNLIKEENYVQFINAEDPGTITLRKELTETGGSQKEEFTFNVTLTKDGSPITKVSSLLNITEGEKIKQERKEFESKDGKYSVTVAPNQERILYNIPLGTQYEISEVEKKDELGGKYEVDSIKITGNHTHNDSALDLNLVKGTLDSVNGSKPAVEATFVNEYHKIAEVNIPVHKTVTGKPFTGVESYTFEITSDTKNAPMPEKTQINVAPGNGMATIAAENVYDAKGQFGPIVFDDTMEPGKYTYTVHEIAGEETNIQYDSHVYHVVVTATKDESGNVSAHITSIDNDPVTAESPVNLEFTNDKVAPIDLSIPVEKNLVGRNVETTDSFTFRISEDETHDNPKRLNTLIGNRSLTIKPDKNNELKGEFILRQFTLEDVGKEYWFVLEEQKGDIKQLDYDTSKTTVKVTFELKDTDGSKTIVPVVQSIEGENPTAIDINHPVVFTNTYHAIGKIEIPVEKTLINKEFGNETYRFEISNPADKDDQPLPSNTVLEISKADADTLENDHAAGKFVIPLTDKEVPLGLNTEFTYEIHEIAGTDPNMVYDSNTYTVTVNATNTAGTITTKIAEGSQNVSITNTNYVPADTIIPIRKVLNGREIKADDTFTFQIRGDAQSRKFILGNDEIKISAQVIDGKLVLQDSSFKLGSFSKEDTGKTFNFTITEESGNEKGMNYDSAVHTVTVMPRIGGSSIVFDIKEGEAKITDSKPLTFTNTYRPTGTLEIPVTKTLKGRSFTNGDRFLFEITGEEGAPLPAQTILSVLPTTGPSVESLFGPITYTEENVGDTYLYTVKEISTGLSGIKYDEAKYEVKVNVTKNDEGKIIPNAIYNNGTTDVNEIEFVNHYDPEVVVKLPVMKTLEGRPMTDSDKFVFDLNGEGSAPMPEHNQVTIQGKGDHTAETTFDPIVFKNEGTYKYRITEHQGSIEHIQYSKVEYTVTVNIAKDPVSGALTSSYSMVSSAAPDVTSDTAAFVNVYQPSGTWRPSVTKELLGAELKDQAYSFEMTVKDNAGAVIYQKEAQNSADGSVDFPLVQFNTVGNYTAVIKEEAQPADSSVQYDTHTIKYTLNVEDHDGELVVTQNPPEPFVFTNDAGLRISKQLIPGSGQTLEENDLNYDFPFEVQFSDNMASKTLHAKRNGKEETLTVGADAKANFKLKHNDTLIVYDIPKNTAYSVSENSGSKWIDKYLQIDTIGDSNGTFSNGVEASVTFRNLKPRTDDVVISGFKTMDPNGDPYPMQAGLYSFKISADGQNTISRNLNKESEFVPEEEPLDESFEIHRSSLPELDINDDEEDPGDSQTEEPEIPAPADSQQKRKLTMIRREAETKAAPEDTPLPDDPIAKNNEFGRFEFGKIVFTTPGIYTYRIEELPSTIPGMKHDTRTYKAEITVVEKNGSVEVQRIRYMDMNNNVLDNPIVFVNTYSETQKPKLEIHKEQSRNFEPFTREKQTVNAGDLVTYRLTVTNTGDALAKNVMIHDTVPVPEGDGDAQLTLLKSSLINNVTLEGNKITWSIGDLAPGTSYSVSFQVQVPKVKSATSWKNIATTTTDSPLDEKPDPSEEVTIESEPAKPDVTIRKYESTTQSGRYDGTESLEVKSGELVTYDMIVTNSGNEDATNVVVTDEVPDGLEFVQAFDGGSYNETNRTITWNVGTLAANGGTAIVSFQIRVPVVDEDKEWPNIATLKYDGEKPKDSNEVKINTIVKNLEIEKLQAINHGPLTKDLQAVKAGDVVTYALHITNPGDHTIENATAKDTVPDGLELITDSISDGGTYNSQTHEIIWNFGKVDAKDEKQVTFSVKVPKVDQKTSWKNIATLIYDNEKPKDSNEVVVGTDLPNLTIVKDQKLDADPDYTFEKRTGQTGDTLTYRLTVTNTGTATAKDVVIEDTIPTAELMETPLFLRFESASDDGNYNPRTQTVTWSIGDVAPGQSRSVTFTVTIPGVKQNTLWINKAYTHYENNPNNPDEGDPKDIPSNEVKVDTMVPAVILEKEHKLNDGDRVTSLLHGNAQDTVTYYLKATNTSMATAHDVWIKDTIPTHENGTLGLKEIDETYAHELNEKTGEIVWKIGDLAPGEEKEVWFSVTVPEVQEATRWRNIASVSHQEDPTVPREEIETPPVEVEVLVPELEIVKRQAKNDGSLTQGLIQANAGDTITYAIEVTNTGTGPAQSIVVEDIVPEGLELVNGSISDQGQNRGGKITWNMASLEAGKTKTFTFKVKVPSVKEYTRWANVATVSDEDDPDPKPTPPVEVETEAPHLTVEKSQKRNEGNRTKDKLSVVGKDRVTYFIKVTNDGQADAKDVVVSDVVPEGLILVDGSVSDSGLVEKGVISWQLGTLATGASRTVSFAVDVPESEGVWKNIAEAIESTHPKEPTPSNEVEIETPKEEPNITIEKLQAQNDAQPSKTRIKARVDDTITYVLRVQNRGKETVRDIVVKDAIPQGLRFVSGSISKEGTIENGVVSWKIEELAPDQLVDLTFQVKVPVVTRNSAWINVGVLIHDDKQTPSNEVTVSIEPETPASSKNGKPTSPNTAAETNHMIWLGALMISVLVLAVLWKRKKNISH